MMSDKTVTFLLVEDDEIDIEAVQRGFGELRIANPLIVARDGVEALEILRGDEKPPLKQPYMILLDLNMPRMNGIEFLAKLREDSVHRDAIVFVLTTSKSDEDRVAAYDKHVAGYIIKSDIREGFDRALDMVDKYWRVVEFPPGR